MAAEASHALLQDILGPIRPILAREEVTDLCINGPGRLFVESLHGWEQLPAENLTRGWLLSFARAVASHMSAAISERAPILSGHLPTGERIQIVLPPAAQEPAVTIRRPSHVTFSLEELAEQGAFAPVAEGIAQTAETPGTERTAGGSRRHRCQQWAEADLQGPGEGRWEREAGRGIGRQDVRGWERGRVFPMRARLAQWQDRDAPGIAALLKEIVRRRLNVLVSGATGSGKTTLTKAMIAAIPRQERLIAIEDARELVFPHPNTVRLFFSRDGAGIASVTVKDLLVACLRMKPDRVLLAELRDDEAYFYLRNVNSGHPGSITSIHANSAAAAVEQLVLMVRQSAAGAGLTRADIRGLVFSLVDVIVQMDRRQVTEIRFLPAAGGEDGISNKACTGRTVGTGAALCAGPGMGTAIGTGAGPVWEQQLGPNPGVDGVC